MKYIILAPLSILLSAFVHCFFMVVGVFLVELAGKGMANGFGGLLLLALGFYAPFSISGYLVAVVKGFSFPRISAGVGATIAMSLFFATLMIQNSELTKNEIAIFILATPSPLASIFFCNALSNREPSESATT